MNTFRTLAFLLSLPSFVQAQTIRQNALDLDGINDEVTVANASALVNGSTALSLTCWVYPTQSANWPNMEAFAGFRDNASADFYLLQTYGTTMEARFRNSGNMVFTLDSSNLLMLNTWQHVALTYDGAMLTMYHEGAVIASMPASGTINSPSVMFRIGNMDIPGSTQIYLDGRVDEVTLWSRALTQAEILCLKDNGALTTDADLKLYYKCDQGLAGGVNTTITSLVDASGHLNGVLSGLALNGASSNFVTGAALPGTEVATVCAGESYTFNGQPLSAAGIYSAAFPTGGACDSIATLSLGVQVVNVNVVQNGPNLSSQATNAQYQWLDCNNGNQQIPNATSPLYSATASGSYAVEVTQNGCADTSLCYAVTITGIEEALGSIPLRVIPAAGAGLFWLELEQEVNGVLRIVALDGRTVHQARTVGRRTLLDLAQEPSGIYVLELRTDDARAQTRFIRE